MEKKNQELTSKKLRNNGVENSLRTHVKKLKTMKNKDDLVKGMKKTDDSFLENKSIDKEDIKDEVPVHDLYRQSVGKNNNACEQKIELPKKRWLREASQDQYLKELNQCRPTVLKLAGKENDSKVQQSNNEPGDSSFIVDVVRRYCRGNSKRHGMQVGSEFSVNTPNLEPVKMFMCGVEEDHDVNTCMTVNSFNSVPHMVVRCNESNGSSEFARDPPFDIAQSNKPFIFRDSENCKKQNEALLSCTSFEKDCDNSITLYSDNVSQVVKLSETQDFDTEHYTSIFTEIQDTELLNFELDDIYNSPKYVGMSHTPVTPSKWNDLPTVCSSTPKFDSAYKKKIRDRFTGTLDESHQNTNTLLPISDGKRDSVDNTMFSEPLCTIDHPNCSITDKSDTVEDVLAYPLLSVTHDTTKPLNLSNSTDYLLL